MGAPLEATNSTAGLLELCVVKATCTVLRGGDVSDDISLPDQIDATLDAWQPTVAARVDFVLTVRLGIHVDVMPGHARLSFQRGQPMPPSSTLLTRTGTPPAVHPKGVNEAFRALTTVPTRQARMRRQHAQAPQSTQAVAQLAVQATGEWHRSRPSKSQERAKTRLTLHETGIATCYQIWIRKEEGKERERGGVRHQRGLLQRRNADTSASGSTSRTKST